MNVDAMLQVTDDGHRCNESATTASAWSCAA